MDRRRSLPEPSVQQSLRHLARADLRQTARRLPDAIRLGRLHGRPGADPVPDRPELPQCVPSSELVAQLLAPGLAPTYSHGALTHGEIFLQHPAQVERLHRHVEG